MRQKYNLTRMLQEWESGKQLLTPQARLAQMFRCQRLRNFTFGLNLPMLSGTAGAAARMVGIARNTAPQFANDLVITNAFFSDCVTNFNNMPVIGAQVNIIGTPGTYVEDLFGVGQMLAAAWLCDAVTGGAGPVFADPDTDVKAMEFVPRLLRKGQVIQASAAFDDPNGVGFPENVQPYFVFQSVFALCEDEPYACPADAVVRAAEKYIKTQARETFILDLRIANADFPATGVERAYFVDANDRPLLIMGIGSNIRGAQIKIRDTGKQHDFTNFFKCPQGAQVSTTNTTSFNSALVQPDYLPISGIAPAAIDSFMGYSYRWLPVPHFLEPNTSLLVTLKAGLRNNAQTMTIAGTATTGHVAFMCVTL